MAGRVATATAAGAPAWRSWLPRRRRQPRFFRPPACARNGICPLQRSNLGSGNRGHCGGSHGLGNEQPQRQSRRQPGPWLDQWFIPERSKKSQGCNGWDGGDFPIFDDLMVFDEPAYALVAVAELCFRWYKTGKPMDSS
eukprot:Skav203650  [mRNA]  locus=scaffold1120:572036:574993:+ [translate_table: standard]